MKADMLNIPLSTWTAAASTNTSCISELIVGMQVNYFTAIQVRFNISGCDVISLLFNKYISDSGNHYLKHGIGNAIFFNLFDAGIYI